MLKILFHSQMQQVYQDATAQGSEGVLVERLKVQFENSIIKQLSLKVSSLNAMFAGRLGMKSFQTACINSNSNISPFCPQRFESLL